MKKRYEEARANMKGKLLNCFVLAIVLLSVSALSGDMVYAAGEHPSGPDPTEITVTVDRQSIPADGAAQSTITAHATDNNEASGGRRLIFTIEEGPDDVELIPELEEEKYTDRAVYNITNENGYAYAKLKAGTTEGQVTIKVYWGEISDTKVVTLKEQGQTDLFNMSIAAGWNLISIPLVLDNTSIDAVFPDASDNDVLYAYEGGWIIATYSSALPGWYGDLATVEPDKGYWYGANAAYTATIEGTEAGARNVSITPGWNLVGYTRLSEAGIDDLIQNVSNNDVLYAYAEGWIIATYSSALPGWYGDLTTMQPGKGYWYGANEQFTWTY